MINKLISNTEESQPETIFGVKTLIEAKIGTYIIQILYRYTQYTHSGSATG